VWLLLETDVSEKCIASIIRMEIISEVRTTLPVTSKRSTLLVTGNVLSSPILVILMMEVIRRPIPEDSILHFLTLLTATQPGARPNEIC
jgi:hypothetical protein